MVHLWACGIFVCLRRHLLLGLSPTYGLHPIWYDNSPIQRVEGRWVLLLLHVYESSATGRLPRALLYEEVYPLHCVSASEVVLLYARRTGKVPSSIILWTRVPAAWCAIARSAVWKTNDWEGSLKHYFMNRSKFSGTHGDRETFIFPVQLITSRIGNLTRLIHTLLYVMTIHTYIHTMYYYCAMHMILLT